MFASLKNKIKEETGNDPTARILSKESRHQSRNHSLLHSTSVQSKLGTSEDNLSAILPSTSSSNEDIRASSRNSLNRLNDGPASVNTESCNESVQDVRDTFIRTTEEDPVLRRERHYTNGKEHRSTEEFKEKIQQYLKEADERGLQDYLLGELEKLNIPDNADKLQKIELQLIEAKHQAKEASKTCELLHQDLAAERSVNADLKNEVSRLREELKTQSLRMNELSSSLARELQEKDVILLRNAQLNQDIEMSKQESRTQEEDTSELESRLSALEMTLMQKEDDMARQVVDNEELQRKINEMQSEEYISETERELKRKMAALEEQLAEKVKSIRVLQQHLTDLKKTLQREMKQNGDESSDNPATLMTAMPTKHAANADTDVNFKYLKHVIMKFLTSREYEAQHLTRAVSTLLRFSPEEERLLRDTLEWKMSWFGTRPRLGYGQTSKTIPPS